MAGGVSRGASNFRPRAVSDAVLEISDLRVHYGPLEALHGVSLSVPAGSVIAVLGRNGAGKTSLLRAIAGNVRTPVGRITWRGTEITRSAASHRAAQGIILIPEDRGIFQTLTVQENLELFAPDGDVAPALDAFPPLRDLLARKAVLLSGGEQQMLALSRALLTPWNLLLIDELSHGLAPALATRLYNVLADLVADRRTHPEAPPAAAADDPPDGPAAVGVDGRRGSDGAGGRPDDSGDGGDGQPDGRSNGASADGRHDDGGNSAGWRDAGSGGIGGGRDDGARAGVSDLRSERGSPGGELSAGSGQSVDLPGIGGPAGARDEDGGLGAAGIGLGASGVPGHGAVSARPGAADAVEGPGPSATAGQLRTVVLAEPHPREATRLADFLYVLRRGEVVFAGPPSELDPSVL